MPRPDRHVSGLTALWRPFAVAVFAAVVVGGASLWGHQRVWARHGAAADDTDRSALVVRAANLISAPGAGVFAIVDRYASRSLDARNFSDALLVHGAFGATVGVGVFALAMARRALASPGRRCARTDVAAVESAQRRRACVDAVGVAMGASAAGAWVYGACVEPWDLRVERVRLPIADLPKSLEGVRIAHVSDLHVGPRVATSMVERAVAAAARERPDLVVLTGDYVDRRRHEATEAARLLAPLVRTAPTVGVLGNHDWYAGGRPVASALREVGVRVIDNRCVWFDPSRGVVREDFVEGGLRLAGGGDHTTGRCGWFRALPPGEDRASAPPTLLLTHNPDIAEAEGLRAADRPRVDLMLAGHTHGGQVRLPLIGAPVANSRYGSRYLGGLVRGPSFPVLVSRGVGMSFLPIRFGVPPEIGVVTLTRG